MPIPRRGDPRRPLYLAARTCAVLGVLGLLASTCALAPLFVQRTGGPTQRWAAVASLVLYGGVGAAYLVSAFYMRRRRTWAVIVALSLSGLGLLFAVAGGGAMAVMLVAGVFRGSAAAPGPPAGMMWGIVAFYGVIAVALGQLVYWLARSFAALKMPPTTDENRGFDVLPVAVLPTAEPGGQA